MLVHTDPTEEEARDNTGAAQPRCVSLGQMWLRGRRSCRVEATPTSRADRLAVMIDDDDDGFNDLVVPSTL